MGIWSSEDANKNYANKVKREQRQAAAKKEDRSADVRKVAKGKHSI